MITFVTVSGAVFDLSDVMNFQIFLTMLLSLVTCAVGTSFFEFLAVVVFGLLDAFQALASWNLSKTILAHEGDADIAKYEKGRKDNCGNHGFVKKKKRCLGLI